MPYIIDTEATVFEHREPQDTAKKFASEKFGPLIDRYPKLLSVFENTQIDTRNFCVPHDFFLKGHTFKEVNDTYRSIAASYGGQSILNLLEKTGVDKNAVTDFLYINSTGLATPTIDAVIINDLGLNRRVNRYPLWGLGCAGGVSGIAKAAAIADANPDALVLVMNVELCSLTFRRNDFTVSNFIAVSLFSDGISSALIAGERAFGKYSGGNKKIRIAGAMSKLYHSSLNIMGWDFLDDGFRVIFSKDIPKIISTIVKDDIAEFLGTRRISGNDIANLVAHPGGAKIIDAYRDSFGIDESKFRNTRKVLREHGNMSSASVIYVLNEFFRNGFDDGYCLMPAVGPGFSLETALLEVS